LVSRENLFQKDPPTHIENGPEGVRENSCSEHLNRNGRRSIGVAARLLSNFILNSNHLQFNNPNRERFELDYDLL